MDKAKVAQIIKSNDTKGLLTELDVAYEKLIQGYISSLIEAAPEKVQMIQGRVRGLQEAQKTIKGFYQTLEELHNG